MCLRCWSVSFFLHSYQRTSTMPCSLGKGTQGLLQVRQESHDVWRRHGQLSWGRCQPRLHWINGREGNNSSSALVSLMSQSHSNCDYTRDHVSRATYVCQSVKYIFRLSLNKTTSVIARGVFLIDYQVPVKFPHLIPTLWSSFSSPNDIVI